MSSEHRANELTNNVASGLFSDAPLCVDLDGTLTPVDTLHESIVALIKTKPFKACLLPFWLLKGKAHFKAMIAQHVTLEAGALPYHDDVVTWVREEAKVRPVYLATAAHESIGSAVANHIGCFKGVFATSEANLAAQGKADRLTTEFGKQQFDYAGNSSDDIAVWRSARDAIVVNATKSTATAAKGHGNVVKELIPKASGVIRTTKKWIKALRVYQWVKNLLVLLPLLAYQGMTAKSWTAVVIAFFSFSLAASGIYLINDVMDLEADREHARKRRRPFASGALSALHGIALAPALVVASLLLAWLVNWKFVTVIVIYLVTTTLYSVWLKRKVFIDTFILAALYTLRVIGGAVAIAHTLSFWLAALSSYGFLSLALLKRYGELVAAQRDGKQDAPGRGYRITDIPVVLALGAASAMVSTLVLALHIDSEASRQRYATPEFLWMLVAVVTLALGRLWIVAARGHMTDDPIVFVAKDRFSISLIAVGAALVWLASIKL
jgi:4-hydroxybenzoate polyprenyltransferase